MTLDPRVTRRDRFHWAVCVPASCTCQDLQVSLNTSVNKVFAKYNLTGEVSVNPDHCHTVRQDNDKFSIGYNVVCIILCILVTFTVVATVYDYATVNGGGQKKMIVLAFSLKINMNNLFKKKADSNLDVVNGIKSITNVINISAHRFMYSYGIFQSNLQFWEVEWSLENSFIFNMLTNLVIFVDASFYCAGTFCFLNNYKTLEEKKCISFPRTLFMRWIRIVPTYMMMMGIAGWCVPRLSNGPLWTKGLRFDPDRCQRNWWLNLLFINNYTNTNQQCLLISWYLACDMQLFVVGMFTTYLLWRSPKIGYLLFTVLLAASIAVPFYVTYAGKYIGAITFYKELVQDVLGFPQMIVMYLKTHIRAAPYLIGIMTAYISKKLQKANYKLSSVTVILGTLLLFVGGYAFQTYSFILYQGNRPYVALEHSLYAGFHRVVFAIGLAWIFATFFISQFEPFRVLLGQPFFSPLARLGFCMNLVHPTIQQLQAFSVRHTEYLEFPKLIWMISADYLLTFLFALFLHLLVEAPARKLTTILSKGNSGIEKIKRKKDN